MQESNEMIRFFHAQMMMNRLSSANESYENDHNVELDQMFHHLNIRPRMPDQFRMNQRDETDSDQGDDHEQYN
jgi:hypothetical protein